MSRFFKPYEGKRPYLFVSYSHRQSDAVVDTIRLLHERRWRVWYDEGIPAGSDWPKNIEQHMRGCAAVLFFLSASALASPNCFSEIKTAIGLKKNVMVMPLEQAELSPEWTALLEKTKKLEPQDSPEERAAAIEKSGVLRRSFRRAPLEGFRWDRLGLAASAAVFLATVAALGSLFTGRITLPGAQQGAEGVSTPVSTPEPTERVDVDMSAWESFFPVSFPDKQQERAVRAALDKPEGNILLSELPGIDALYFCGNMNLKSLDDVRFEADGTLTVNGASPIEGTVADLGVIGRMPLLEELALIRQPATDLSPLAALTQLHTLSLAGSALSTLDTLAGQGSVETLHLEHSGVRELSALGELPGLKTVTVSAEMLPLSWDDGADYEIILVR